MRGLHPFSGSNLAEAGDFSQLDQSYVIEIYQQCGPKAANIYVF